jgi:hypothetical protein
MKKVRTRTAEQDTKEKRKKTFIIAHAPGILSWDSATYFKESTGVAHPTFSFWVLMIVTNP